MNNLIEEGQQLLESSDDYNEINDWTDRAFPCVFGEEELGAGVEDQLNDLYTSMVQKRTMLEEG